MLYCCAEPQFRSLYYESPSTGIAVRNFFPRASLTDSAACDSSWYQIPLHSLKRDGDIDFHRGSRDFGGDHIPATWALRLERRKPQQACSPGSICFAGGIGSR